MSHIRQFFNLEVLLASHPAVRRLRKQVPGHSHHGNKLWKASALLVDYFQEFPLPMGCRILEVGAGWGISGIYCAKYFAAQVTALDVDPAVFPVLALQADCNGVSITPRVQALETLTATELSEFDVLIASDICFWDKATEPLVSLLLLAQQMGLRCILSDPGRPPFIAAVNALIDLLASRDCEIVLENWSVPHPHNISGLILDIPGEQ